ncbi:hypothetical protein L3081_05985 [Colwellia sp. MSW7]|uniref:Uncharacterized protein n=1 Tax=Colwellia maritima TaxID=2912588 RepID=A0ABS9WYM0_9GAMM|nr:hypothetical protein [Colwellia maritima]MCI2283030.1 hypothetical protein [Colwellia maritima]
MLNSEQIHEVLKGICKEESAKSSHPIYAYEHKLTDNLFIYVKRKKGLRLNVIPYDLVNDECDITRIRDAFRNNLPKLNL